MADLLNFPVVMAHADHDLSANVRGKFSPQDWEAILSQAQGKLETQLQSLPTGEPDRDQKAWQAVVLDFYRNSYWGFQPNYVKPSTQKNFGVSFLILAFTSLTITKVAIAWFGQVYSSSDEPRDAYIFYAVLALVVCWYVFFLWRMRHFKD